MKLAAVIHALLEGASPKQLLEVFEASLQEKMAMDNLRANTSSWRNWKNAMTLTGTRHKAVQATVKHPIDTITIGLGTMKVGRFIVTDVFDHPSGGPQIDIIAVDRAGKPFKTMLIPIHVETAHKAGIIALDVVDMPREVARSKTKVATDKKKSLSEILVELRTDKNKTNDIYAWRDAFERAEKEGQEILVEGLYRNYMVAITNVNTTTRNLHIISRDLPYGPLDKTWKDVAHLDRRSVEKIRGIAPVDKDWYESLKTTWKNDTIANLKERNRMKKGTHFYYHMKRLNEASFQSFHWGAYTTDWRVSIQAGKAWSSYPRRNGLLIDDYDEWSVTISRPVSSAANFNIHSGIGMTPIEQSTMPFRDSFTRDVNNAPWMRTEHVNELFQWMLNRWGKPKHSTKLL